MLSAPIHCFNEDWSVGTAKYCKCFRNFKKTSLFVALNYATRVAKFIEHFAELAQIVMRCSFCSIVFVIFDFYMLVSATIVQPREAICTTQQVDTFSYA